jgi:hypothetical protein
MATLRLREKPFSIRAVVESAHPPRAVNVLANGRRFSEFPFGDANSCMVNS